MITFSSAAGADVEDPWSAWEFFRRLVWKRAETLPIPSIVRILLRSALVASAARAMEDRAAADLLTARARGWFMQGLESASESDLRRAIAIGERALAGEIADVELRFALQRLVSLAHVRLAGILITPTQYTAFNVGVPFAISGFIAAILGGFGSAMGAFVGGILPVR